MKVYLEEKLYLPESFTSLGAEINEVIENSETNTIKIWRFFCSFKR